MEVAALTDEGMDLLSQREGGFVLTPYQDSKGIWTDGLGNIHGVVPNGPPISLEKAEADFQRNLAWVKGALSGVTVPLESYQSDALYSLIFNIGGGGFGSSTILHRLNAGDYDGAAAAFDMWHIPPEIISRRNAEREQFKGTQFQARIS